MGICLFPGLLLYMAGLFVVTGFDRRLVFRIWEAQQASLDELSKTIEEETARKAEWALRLVRGGPDLTRRG